MFPIDKRVAQMVWYPAADVIPQLIHALDDVPEALWNEHSDLYELDAAVNPALKKHGVRKWDFIWSMERHFSAPYGPLPKASISFMAGIPDIFLEKNVECNDGVEVKVKPLEFEAKSVLPTGYREWLEKLFFAHGECMLPVFGADALGKRSHYYTIDEFTLAVAPDAESRLRVNNFTSEEYKHQYQFYHVYNEFDPGIPTRIYQREQEVFRAYPDVQPRQDWVDRALFHMLADRFGVYQGFEWVRSSYAPLARASLQVVKDERGHSNYGYLHVRDALERDSSIRPELQARIDDFFYPMFIASFGSSNSQNNKMWRQWGLKLNSNDTLRAAYHSEMALVLESLGLSTPDMQVALEKGMQNDVNQRAAKTIKKVAN